MTPLVLPNLVDCLVCVLFQHYATRMAARRLTSCKKGSRGKGVTWQGSYQKKGQGRAGQSRAAPVRIT